MRITISSLTALGIFFCAAFAASGQDKPKAAKDFFPGPGDTRKVIYIETADDEVLTFDDSDNASYVLDGRALEIRSAKVRIHGNVSIRGFVENAHGLNAAGAAPKGDNGTDGGAGSG